MQLVDRGLQISKPIRARCRCMPSRSKTYPTVTARSGERNGAVHEGCPGSSEVKRIEVHIDAGDTQPGRVGELLGQCGDLR